MKKLMIVRPKAAVAGLALVLASAVTSRAAIIHVPANYPTIQAAVDAARNGDTIRIAPGVYEQQVVVADKSLTLRGSPGTVLRAWPEMEQTMTIAGSDRVTLLGVVRAEVVVSGLAFEGQHLGDNQPGAFTGIFFAGGGGRVLGCRLTGFRGSALGSADGADGVLVANPVFLGTGAINVDVLGCNFADNLTSIVLLGDAGSPHDPTLLRTTFAVDNNVILGNGPDTTAAQYGIYVWAGAAGEVKRNTITDHAYVGTGLPNNSSTPLGIGLAALDNGDFGAAPLAALQPLRFEGNVFRNNQVHCVLLRGDGSTVVNNSFEGTAPGYRPGGLAFSGENVMVVANRFDNVPLGVVLFGNDPDFGTYLGIASNAKLVANRFCQVPDPIVVESVVTGTEEHGNQLDACH